MSDTLGELLKKHRRLQGLTQTALATALHCDQSYLSKIETGRRPISDVALLRRISKTLSISPNQLGIAHSWDNTSEAPPWLPTAVLEELRTTNLVRQNMHMRFALNKTAGASDGLDLGVYLTWDIVNFGDEPIEYQPSFVEEEHERAKVVQVYCIHPDGKGFQDTRPRTRLSEGLDNLVPSRSRARIIAPRSKPLRYGLTYVLGTPRHIKDSALFSFAGLTKGVTLQVESPSGLRVGVYPESSKLQLNQWAFGRVFMKEQHVTVSWRPVVD